MDVLTIRGVTLGLLVLFSSVQVVMLGTTTEPATIFPAVESDNATTSDMYTSDETPTTEPPTSTTDPVLVALYSILGVLGMFLVAFLIAIILFCCWQKRLTPEKDVAAVDAASSNPEADFEQYRMTEQERQQHDMLMTAIPPPLARGSVCLPSSEQPEVDEYNGLYDSGIEDTLGEMTTLPPSDEADLVNSGVLLGRPVQVYPRMAEPPRAVPGWTEPPRPVSVRMEPVRPPSATDVIYTNRNPGVYRASSEIGAYGRYGGYRPAYLPADPGPSPVRFPRYPTQPDPIPRSYSDGVPATDFRDISMVPDPQYAGYTPDDLYRDPTPTQPTSQFTRSSAYPGRRSNLYTDPPTSPPRGSFRPMEPLTPPDPQSKMPTWMKNELLNPQSERPFNYLAGSSQRPDAIGAIPAIGSPANQFQHPNIDY